MRDGGDKAVKKKMVTKNNQTFLVPKKIPIYKRIWFLILCAIVLLLIFIFIGGIGRNTEKAAEKGNSQITEVSAAPVKTAGTTESSIADYTSIGDRLSKPAIIGDMISFDLSTRNEETIDIKLNGIYNSVNGKSVEDYLVAENQFNPKATEGRQWVVIDAKILYRAKNPDNKIATKNIMLEPIAIVDKQLQPKVSVMVSDQMKTRFKLINDKAVNELIPVLIPTELTGHYVIVRFNGFLDEDYRYIRIYDDTVTAKDI